MGGWKNWNQKVASKRFSEPLRTNFGSFTTWDTSSRFKAADPRHTESLLLANLHLGITESKLSVNYTVHWPLCLTIIVLSKLNLTVQLVLFCTCG